MCGHCSGRRGWGSDAGHWLPQDQQSAFRLPPSPSSGRPRPSWPSSWELPRRPPPGLLEAPGWLRDGSNRVEGLLPLCLRRSRSPVTQWESLGPCPAHRLVRVVAASLPSRLSAEPRVLSGSGPVKGCPLPLEPNNCLLLCCVVSGARGLSFVGTCCGESLPA